MADDNPGKSETNSEKETDSGIITISDVEKAKFIWEEYKYRHQHIWNLIFQITVAVVAVSIIPYLPGKYVEEKVGPFIIAIPFIGLALTIVSTLRIKEECLILNKIREKHREFHYSKYQIPYNKVTTFTKHVILYFVALIVLSILNVGVVAFNTFSGK